MSTDLIQVDATHSELRLTLEEALTLAQRVPDMPDPSSRREDDDDGYGYFPGRSRNWHGGSFEENVRMAFEGDPETALQIKRTLGTVAGIHVAPRATRRLDVAGSTVDMARYMRGEPENMVNVMRARRPTAVIRMGIERAVNSGTSTETVRQVGVSVLAVIERLRTAGIAAEIWATFGTACGGHTHSTQILIQEAGRPIDIDRLAYWVANSGALRRIVFSIWENQSREFRAKHNIGGSYGRAVEPSRDSFDELVPADAVRAREWIGEVLKRRSEVQVLAPHEIRARSEY